MPADSITDQIVALAVEHGWTVDDRRATGGIAWFRRGPEYAHLGTTTAGEQVLSVYGGIVGRPARFWVAPIDPVTRRADRHAELTRRLTAPPYTYTD